MTAYDDTNLQRLFDALDERRRAQALRGGFRQAANKVRKAAVGNLRSSGIRTDGDLERGVRSAVFRRKVGFRVTIGTSGQKGFHTNRRGLKKPVLPWAEGGTKERRTKGGGGRAAVRRRAAHGTGRMPRYAFMEKTLAQVRDGVTADLHEFIENNIIKTARRYGCIV